MAPGSRILGFQGQQKLNVHELWEKHGSVQINVDYIQLS